MTFVASGLIKALNPRPYISNGCRLAAGSGKRYMAHKNQMLAEQFQALAAGLASSVAGPLAASQHLFRGVGIHVNGFTRPSNLELKQVGQPYM